jgi:hypothetical protein
MKRDFVTNNSLGPMRKVVLWALVGSILGAVVCLGFVAFVGEHEGEAFQNFTLIPQAYLSALRVISCVIGFIGGGTTGAIMGATIALIDELTRDRLRTPPQT